MDGHELHPYNSATQVYNLRWVKLTLLFSQCKPYDTVMVYGYHYYPSRIYSYIQHLYCKVHSMNIILDLVYYDYCWHLLAIWQLSVTDRFIILFD